MFRIRLDGMIGFGPRTPAPLISGALSALLAGALSPPPAARAGCDYPVTVWRGDPVSANSSHDMPAHAAKPDNHLPSRSDAPCHGPTCSRRPAPSPVTIPSPP